MPCQIPCPYQQCTRTFMLQGHLTKHIKPLFRSPSPSLGNNFDDPPSPPSYRSSPSPSPPPSPPMDRFNFHPFLTGEKCDKDGNALPPGAPPEPLPEVENPWAPFQDEIAYRLADLVFKKVEMSQPNIDELLDLWCLDVQRRFGGDSGPFGTHGDLLETIDSIQDGSAPWQCFQTEIEENLPVNAPEWRKTSYQVWYRDPDTVIANMLSNPDFAKDFDAAPYVHIGKDGKRCWSDFMSGNYSFRHATQIYEDPETGGENVAGAMYCLIILGADKTTVSVATGHVEYHPLYLSIGNLHNSARRGHRNGVIPIGFLAIPKADRKYNNDNNFRIFKKRLYHSSLVSILSSLRPAMTTPVVRQCPDGYFRRIIYDLAAFIADYPEQVMLAGIVQGWCCRCTAHFSDLDGTGEPRTREWVNTLFNHYQGEPGVLWDNYGIDDDVLPFTHYFPRANIHEILTADLLHQVIKGCFKDMIVEWVVSYLTLEHGEARAKEILDEVDHRISVVPSFPGLRRFPHGCHFKQWTGDDSKALMKVFLPAILEYIPYEMSRCISSFLDFCYLVRRNDFTTDTIAEIQAAIHSFHHYREIFISTGVREHFSIPRMHSITHYPALILDFAAPNGVCSSITESRHITAMLLTNQRLDKLAALRAMLVERKLMPPLKTPPPPDPFDTEVDERGQETRYTASSGYPRSLEPLAAHVQQSELPALTRQFLYEQTTGMSSDDVDLEDCPEIFGFDQVQFYALSDNAGIHGMHRERIRCTPSWYGQERRDTVAVVIDDTVPGFRGMSAARVHLFFSFKYQDNVYPCALVHWFNTYGRSQDPNTGLWIVRPAYHDSLIHLDTLLRGVHLIPNYGPRPLNRAVKFYHSLDAFSAYYVDRLADYHANEILF
ncbi:hypothetical protein BT96DRAFT_1086980 [Gymnopus androsaceus JB14]|uniref:C2H2-type domain-containing protein n=1 Tax=Gymnopus androsaceus JB14 TaxID=1447944 RepID=A0A6A4GKW6_9AGAR|nr:hypothetical protein BT96DRAFT_1086980 [Gymnopus androsaceus JB14]